MHRLLLLLLVACCGCVFQRGASESGVKYLDEFDLSVSSSGYGKRVLARQSVNGHPISLAGKTYLRGIGTHPESGVAFLLNGKVSAFDAVVGIDDDAKSSKLVKYHKAGAFFKVWADGKILWNSGVRREDDKPITVHLDLRGVREVVLETASFAPWCAFDGSNADWADARFTYEVGAEIEVVDDPERFSQLGVLTPPVADAPRINGSDIWGVRPGHPIIFRVPVSGARPLKYSVSPLPDGVVFDHKKGVIRGKAPMVAGDYDIVVSLENAYGKASRIITLKVGETIALTPPMGWNSWNIWGWSLTEENIRMAALAMDRTGLADHGWSYVNLDDWWARNNSGCPRSKERNDVKGTPRDASGRVLVNGGFGDMKALTDFIHSLGLKAGIYSSPGPLTCGMCEGSYGHEAQDAATYAEWGFDYLKYDWCSYGDVMKKELAGRKPGAEDFAKPYRLMGKCLREQNRDIVYAFCQYGMGGVEKWGRDAGANAWRTWSDLKDTWTWMEYAIKGCINAEHYKYTGPGFWADPDMMIVGLQRSFGSTHPTCLTSNEQYTHVSLWALLASPMLIGCDLDRLDEFTLSLLINDEVIAINQDRLGKQARRVRHVDASDVWVRPLANGDYAVGLVNRYPLAREVSVGYDELEIENCEYEVRDCWRQQDEGRISGAYSVYLPPHATKLIRLHRVRCSRCE